MSSVLGSPVPSGSVDVHQHLWPAELLEALRRRTSAPMLHGWTLITDGEAAYECQPEDHDPARHRGPGHAELDRIVLSPSTPLGIESLPPDDAAPLLAAWHDGVRALGAPYLGWVAATRLDPDLRAIEKLLLDPAFVGLQVSAADLGSPQALTRLAPVLAVAESLDQPVLVHPGPAPAIDGAPAWWAPVVQYSAQLQSAWWAWQAEGRRLLPRLRICFVAGAGLAPLAHERFKARAGGVPAVDPGVYVDTSALGRQGIDALTRALSIDAVVLGSDHPYAPIVDPGLGDAAWAAITTTNPTALIEGGAKR